VSPRWPPSSVGPVAVTIDCVVLGFREWRYRWQAYQDERSFPEWKSA
jgi:hypothetical protein